MSIAPSAPLRRSGGDTRDLLLLLAAHVVLWTAFCLLYLAPSDLQNDMAEAFSWAQEMPLGTYKHPPFHAWVVHGWFSLFPTADWGFYLLSSINAAIVTQFAIPIFSLSPLAAILWLRLAIDRAALRRLALLAGIGGLLLLSAAPFAGAWTLRHDIEHAAEPRRLVAERVTALWRQQVGTLLAIVAGSESYALGATFYSPDHPTDFTAFAPAYAPWIDADRLRRGGLAVICLKDDEWCLGEAAKYRGLDTWRTEFSVAKRLRGVTGRAFDVVVVFVRPGQTLPLEPIRLRPF